MVEVLTAAVGDDSLDDTPCGGASLAGEACGTNATDALEERGPIANSRSESLDERRGQRLSRTIRRFGADGDDDDPAAAPVDPAARLLLATRKKEVRWCLSRAPSSDAPMPTAAASPPKGNAFITPTASPSAGSTPPSPAGSAISPLGAASLAGTARATNATGSGQPNALPLQLFVPNGVDSVGVKRAGGDLEDAEGCGEGASGAVARKQSKKSKIHALKNEVAHLKKEGTLLVPPPPSLNPFPPKP
jgi:hypothetical protein